MPQPGEILVYRDYEFEDGSRADKLFVVLNSANLDVPCLVLKTTSQARRYSDARQGCNQGSKVFFVPTNWEDCFKIDTYIQLPEIFEISTGSLLQGSLSRTISIVSKLSDNCFSQLKSCLRRFKDDITDQHWNLIFGRR